MADLTPNRRTFTWAPKTLVVISCALALLALQPSMGTGTLAREPRRSIVLTHTTTSGESTLKEAPARTLRATRNSTPAPNLTSTEAWLGNARKLHILATVEILQRLLLGELQRTHVHMAAGIWVDEICLGIAFVPPERKTAQEWTAEDLPMRERQFAITHCLLAPPTC
jgi:hypothetical protein